MSKIKNFIETWKNRGYEKGETQKFWLQFLRDVLQVDKPENFVEFEVPVKLKHKSFIDVFFPDSKVIVEQKSLSVDLEKNQSQSDGEILSPFEQAQRYGVGLPLSMHPRFIIVCNFQEFLIYDMETLAEPIKIFLQDLEEKFHAFDFLIDATKNKIRLELEISLKAGEIVGKIYDALKAQYINPNSAETLQSLNKLCVRLVFCLYAESAGIFGKRKIFRDYLQGSRNIRRDLILLFEILKTPLENRDEYLENELKIFPYVNGGLFDDEKIEIPNFTPEIKNLLLEEAENFNWSSISPTIFGAVFESTLNPVTRREGGMHYTSVENIHKVIDNLFLNDLYAEFNSCKKNRKKLLALQDKISKLKFFDPACGSGNFLTESYISLRRLENEILKELLQEKILLGDFDNPVKISINQFFGIEINDFAVSVAQTALWIAELQMLQETQEIIHKNLNPLPLKNFANIFEGNALKIDWQKICPQADFIFGNPPFVGHQWRTPAQVEDMKIAFYDHEKHGKLDYVCAWYNKAADFIKNTKIQCAFVSTNSICQGESVRTMWEFLFNKKIIINFAYRTFQWDSESFQKAHVHCVIIGFANFHREQKIIFDGDKKIFAKNINGYLLDAPNIFIENRGNPPKNFPKMTKGSQPTDGGNLILSPAERDELLKKFPQAEKFIKPFIGAEEFINGKQRFCLWLVDALPNELKKIPPIVQRLEKVSEFRKTSKTKSVRDFAESPTLFTQIRQPKNNFLVVPNVSSERRKYIPIGFLNEKNIISHKLLTIQSEDLFLFGILSSSVHMAWTKIVTGRLEMRFMYSPAVYNNFPFPDKNFDKISLTAEKILDVRKNYPDASLADLYDPILMPKDLRDAHKKNDLAVMEAYGFDKNFSEQEILSALMNLYQNFVEK